MRLLVSTAAADPLHVGAAVALLRDSVDALHVDLADGRFVPSLSGSVELVAALAAGQPLAVEVHLMVQEPERWLPGLAAARAARAIVHLEASPYPWRTVALARRLGLAVGMALNPATPIGALETIAPLTDLVSLLTTEPDEAGELLLPGMAERVAAARRMLPGRVVLEVDGGVAEATARSLVAAGAGSLVAGRAILRASDPVAAAARLRAAASVEALP
jgi:ribulose-phosphate 3-epimerase